MKEYMMINNAEWISLSGKCTQVLKSSSHVNIYNNSGYNIFYKLIEIIRNLIKFVLSFVGASQKFNFSGMVVVYIGSEEKTLREVSSLVNSRYKNQYRYYVDGKSSRYPSVGELKSRLGFVDLLSFIKNIVPILEQYRAFVTENKIDNLLLKIIYFTRYLSCLALIRSLCIGLSHSKPDKMLNFFSGSYFGSCLNSACKLQGLSYFSYTWGSNLKGEEQLYSEVGNLLLKSQYDAASYRDRDDYDELNVDVVGNLSFSERIKSASKSEFDILLIDTCYSEYFKYKDKNELYGLLFNLFKDKNLNRVCVKPHPSSNIVDLNSILDAFEGELDITIVSGADKKLEPLYEKSKVIININSTEVLFLRYCALKVINLFPYFIKEYSNKRIEDHTQFCKTNLIDVYSISNLSENWSSYLSTEIRLDKHFDSDGIIAANKLGVIIGGSN